MSVTILHHPLSAHFVTHLRDQTTKPTLFRLLCKRITLLLAIEATADIGSKPRRIRTPLEAYEGTVLAEPIVAVPILRAGLGMLDPVVELFPDVAVGYVGLERDEATARASAYYTKLPSNMSGCLTLVLDPMLATGGSAVQAIDRIKQAGAGTIKMLCIVSAPEGVAYLEEVHPDVSVITAAMDRELNSSKYILPGLGDFGDRLYGTLP